MAQPARKAGGLYGGIQFSSATTFTPSSLTEDTPQPSDIDKNLTTTAPQSSDAGSSAAHTATEASTTEPDASSGKATAGILSTFRRA